MHDKKLVQDVSIKLSPCTKMIRLNLQLIQHRNFNIGLFLNNGSYTNLNSPSSPSLREESDDCVTDAIRVS